MMNVINNIVLSLQYMIQSSVIRDKGELSIILQQNILQNAQSRINQKISLQIKKKSLHDSNMILNCLKNNFIFYNLDEDQLENVKQKIYYAEVSEDVELFSQGSSGTCFFIIEKGLVEISIKDKPSKELKSHDCFGEMALLYDTPRTSSAKTKQQTTFWVIDRQRFRQAVEEVIINQYQENRKLMEGLRFFYYLTNQQKDAISSAVTIKKFYKNQVLIQQGDPGSSFFLIKQGTVSVSKGNKFIRKLTKGDSFGQQSLYYNTMRQLTVTAEDEVKCLILGRQIFVKVLKQKVHEIAFGNFIRWSFEKNSMLSKLTKEQIDKVIEKMKINAFKANDTIFKKAANSSQKLVVLIEGSLKRLKTGVIVASKGQCWGEQFLLDSNRNKIFEDEIVMQTDGVIAEISFHLFFQSIGGNVLQQIIKTNEKNLQNKIIKFENKKKKQFGKIELNELFYLQKLKQCQFGEISVVKNAKGDLFIMKTMNKVEIVEFDVQKYIMQERKILDIVAFPFIIEMIKPFNYHDKIIYILEYIQGMDLFEVMKQIGLLSTSDCVFYTASMILILEYLHQNKIILRDIKPENFMVDLDGYLKLINMSAATMKKSSDERTTTIIGTPHYMAPEVIIGKGYNQMIDFWSLGVCLYEFMCGCLPFADMAQSPYQIYDQIIKNELKFPDFIKDKKAKKLIEQLLNHNPEIRNGGSYTNLKNNPWFEELNWDDLIWKNSKKLEPPFKPDLPEKNKLFESLKPQKSVVEKLSDGAELDNKSDTSSSMDWGQF